MSNLKQIGLSLKSYSVDNDEWYPQLMNQLVEGNYLVEGPIFSCPSRRPEATITNNAIDNIGFHYITDHADVDEVSVADAGANTSMNSDRKGNHTDYGNVLFSAGHVKPIPGTKWYNDADVTSQLSEEIDQ